MSAILNSAILDSTILNKKNFTHSLSLNFMLAAILNTAILDSAILHKTLTQTNSFSLNLIMPDIFMLPSWIQPVWTKKNFTHLFWLNFIMAAILNSTILDSAILHKNSSLIHSDSTWWLQPSWILLCGFSHCHLEFRHLVIFFQIHSKTLSLLPDSNQFNLTQTHSFLPNLMMSAILKSAILDSAILNKKTSLIHSDSTLWCQPSWILPFWIQPFCTKKNFTHSFWLYLMVTAILNSAMLDSATAILDSDTLLSSLRFTQKHSHSTLTLTETNSI